MKKLFILFIALFAPVLYAADAQLDEAHEALEAARLQLDEAARHFAELSADISVAHLEIGAGRAFLGVLIGKSDEEGVHLVGVTPGGSAGKVGIESGDIIVNIEGIDLTGLDHPQSALSRVMGDKAPGDMVSLDVRRGEDILRFDLEAGKGGIHKIIKILHGGDLKGFSNFDISTIGSPMGILDDLELNLHGSHGAYTMIGGGGFDDLKLVDMDENLGDYFGVDAGVLVVNAPADASLRSGDILETIAGAPVDNAAEAQVRLLHQNDTIELQVRRQGVVETIQLEPVKGMHHFLGGGVKRIIKMIRGVTPDGTSHEIEVRRLHFESDET